MSYYDKIVGIETLVGKTITKVQGLQSGTEEIIFSTRCGKVYKMYHEQDCCEDVHLSDFEGDSEDILDGLVVSAEERSNIGDEDSEDKPSEYCESFTWTFYDIQTTKGSLWLRWLGESNGFYSETVYFIDITNDVSFEA